MKRKREEDLENTLVIFGYIKTFFIREMIEGEEVHKCGEMRR